MINLEILDKDGYQLDKGEYKSIEELCEYLEAQALEDVKIIITLTH